jgi:hypothetical protein
MRSNLFGTLYLDISLTQYQVLFDTLIAPSQIERIAAFAKIIGKHGGTLRVLVDHVSQIPFLERISQLSGYPTYVYIAVDAKDHHLGLNPHSASFAEVFHYIEQIVLREGPIPIAFVGLYCHLAYEDVRYDDLVGLQLLQTQLSALLSAAKVQGVRLSLNTTPSVLQVIYNKGTAFPGLPRVPILEREVQNITQLLGKIRDANHQIEIHATGDPFMQETNTHCPLTIMTEVLSSYVGRGHNGTTEYLIAAGTSSLGQTTTSGDFSYGRISGWGLSVGQQQQQQQQYEAYGLGVRRAKRDSAVLVSSGPVDAVEPLKIGQRVLIFPNNGGGGDNELNWYFVVDSSRLGREDEIIDIYVRWRG